jgi:hypothetical protein
MKKNNAYTESIIGLNDKELFEYINNYETYQEGAVIAAIWELEERGLANEKAEKLLAKLETEYHEKEESLELTTTKKEVHHFEPIIRKEGMSNLPRLYTRNVILVFSILFSTFFGSILMAINLKRLKKDKEAFFVILFGLAFTYFSSYLLSLSNLNIFIFPILINVAGAYLIDILFWKKHIGLNTPYERQPIRGLMLVVLLLFMIFIYAMMKNPELLETLLNQKF